MSMKRTLFDAVCSQIERPKMSLTGSRCLQLEPISNGPDAKAHEYHLIMPVLSHVPLRPLCLCFSVNHGAL